MNDSMPSLGQSVKDFERPNVLTNPQEPGLYQNYNKLRETVEALEQRVERLAEKLSPVLRPEMSEQLEAAKRDTNDRKTQSSFAHDLDNMTDRVLKSWLQIDDLLTRCEL